MSTLSAVDYAVISQALLATAREMGEKLIRSAYSPIVREGKDASSGILDATGAAVAQSDELIPILVGSLSYTFKACLERYPIDSIEEDDFFIANHPYEGGQHLPDIFIFLPIFVDGAIVGFSATVAHHLDIGGGAPGLNNSATDLYQEGLIIPPSKYSRKRDWNGAFGRLIASNVRVPSQTIGDLDAQFAACSTGVTRVQELCAKYGPGRVRDAMSEMIAYVERRLRVAITTLPDGCYSAEDWVDDNGVTTDPLQIQATVTVRGNDLAVDFSGTCPQVSTHLNVPFASVISAVLAAVKGFLSGDDIPFNEGANRAVTISAPHGSLLNPRPPAPVRARMEAAYRAYDCVLKALSQAKPESAIACGYDTTTSFCLSHLDNGRYQVFIELRDGGFGGSARGDGADAVAGPLSNCTNVPVESIDADFDFFRIEGYGLRPGSGGAGQFRGGMGSFRSYRILKPSVRLALYADRFAIPAAGFNGGEPGSCGSCTVHRGEEIFHLRSKDDMLLQAGDLVVLESGGGGGYGDAKLRAEEA